VVAMTEEQVRNMFGRRTKMRKLAVHRARKLSNSGVSAQV